MLWFEMVKLSDRVGFSSTEITNVLEDDTDKIAQEMLCGSIPQDMGELTEVHTQKGAEFTEGIIAGLPTIADDSSPPCMR